MNELVRLRHRHRGERPYQQFGLCTSCRRVRDDTGRPLFVTGRRRAALVCLECFARPRARRRAAA